MWSKSPDESQMKAKEVVCLGCGEQTGFYCKLIHSSQGWREMEGLQSKPPVGLPHRAVPQLLPYFLCQSTEHGLATITTWFSGVWGCTVQGCAKPRLMNFKEGQLGRSQGCLAEGHRPLSLKGEGAKVPWLMSDAGPYLHATQARGI